MDSLQPRSPGSNSLCRPGPSTNASNSITSEYRVVSDTQHREASTTAKAGMTPTVDHRLMNLLTPLKHAQQHCSLKQCSSAALARSS